MRNFAGHRGSIPRRCATNGQVSLTLTALAIRTGIACNTLSQHLAHLRTAGLLVSQRKGKEIWYEIDEKRVRLTCGQQPASGERQPDAGERFSLTLTARGSAPASDVAVTITVGSAGGNDGAG